MDVSKMSLVSYLLLEFHFNLTMQGIIEYVYDYVSFTII